MDLSSCLISMKEIYSADPVKAVRGQKFINVLHDYIADALNEKLSERARKEGIQVIKEATLYGSFKPKDVDVAVIHPINGPLITVGLRSQMSSIGKNVLTYYQDIVGECVSLQERFPMTTMGYLYLHPLTDPQASSAQPDHKRYTKLYSAIAQRDDRLYKQQTGSYDHFAYLVVDFNTDEPVIRDDIVIDAEPEIDMSIETFVDRLVDTFVARNVWLDYLFV